MTPVYFETIVKYCLGTKLYKENNRDSFIKAAGHIDVGTLNKIANMHLLNFLFKELQQLTEKSSGDNFSDVLKLIEPHVVYAKNLNNAHLGELARLNNELIMLDIKPILLKGPAYWGDIYEDYSLRNIKDLDILFLDHNDIEPFVLMLRSKGYSNQFQFSTTRLKQLIDNRENYELEEGAYFRKFNIGVNEPESKHLDEIISWKSCIKKGSNRLISKTKGKYFGEVEVAIHKSVFMYNNKTYPKLESDMFVESSMFSHFRVMSKAINLPYLSVKLSMDNELNILKSIKLIKDFIEIFQKATPSEFSKSIEYANEWNVTKEYLNMLNIVKELLPDYDLTGICDLNSNPFVDILSKVYNT